MAKRIFSLTIAALMLMTVMLISPISASAQTSGTCGGNVF